MRGGKEQSPTIARISSITLVADPYYREQFPSAFSIIASESTDFLTDENVARGAMLSQARVIYGVTDFPVPEEPNVTIEFSPQIETRYITLAFTGLRYYQDEDL